jgi:hypothetical protein
MPRTPYVLALLGAMWLFSLVPGGCSPGTSPGVAARDSEDEILTTYETVRDGYVAQAVPANEAQEGDIVVFGDLYWRVLAVEVDRALLVTVEVVERRPYNSSGGQTTWSSSSMRAYLNDRFMSIHFSDDEIRRVAVVENTNPDNQKYGTAGGGDTQDAIFLLSAAEASRYFADASDRAAAYRNETYWWWLRTPGSVATNAAVVDTTGEIDTLGHGVGGYATDYTGFGGLRPALWLERGELRYNLP